MTTHVNLPASEPKTRLQRTGFWIAHNERSKLITLLALVGGLAAIAAAAVLKNHVVLASILLAAGIFSLCYVRLSMKVKKFYAVHEYLQSDNASNSSHE
jgi:hypothetical protein